MKRDRTPKQPKLRPVPVPAQRPVRTCVSCVRAADAAGRTCSGLHFARVDEESAPQAEGGLAAKDRFPPCDLCDAYRAEGSARFCLRAPSAGDRDAAETAPQACEDVRGTGACRFSAAHARYAARPARKRRETARRLMNCCNTVVFALACIMALVAAVHSAYGDVFGDAAFLLLRDAICAGFFVTRAAYLCLLLVERRSRVAERRLRAVQAWALVKGVDPDELLRRAPKAAPQVGEGKEPPE